MSEFLDSQPELEQQPEEMLFENKDVRVVHPVQPAFPTSEGIHLVVEPKKPDVIAESKAVFYSLGVAKTVAEGKFTPDFWANIHRSGHPGTAKGTNVYGKNPQSVKGWGKPIIIRKPEERVEEPLSTDQKQKQERQLNLYLPKWEKALDRAVLFGGGINEVPPSDEAFQKTDHEDRNRNWPWQSVNVWMNDKYEMSLQLQPHIKGIHLVIGGRYDYWNNLDRTPFKDSEKVPVRPWETPIDPSGSIEYLQGTVEEYAILRAAQEVIEEEIGGFYHREIHFSGNWGFKPRDAGEGIGGKEVDESYLSEEYVSLPSRSKLEKPEEWKDIPEWDEKTAEALAERIRERITQWLKDHHLENQSLQGEQ